jgi:hypothetical protein
MRSAENPSPTEWYLVKPGQYLQELPGSIALATFHLVHFVIGGKDFWNAVPVTLRLLTSKIPDAFEGESDLFTRQNAELILGSPSGSSSPAKSNTAPSQSPSPSKRRRF